MANNDNDNGNDNDIILHAILNHTIYIIRCMYETLTFASLITSSCKFLFGFSLTILMKS